MEVDRFDASTRLLQLLKTWRTIPNNQREAPASQVILAEIRGIGEGVAYVGGWDAMQAVDRAVSKAGGPNHLLNDLWDGIGAWVS